MSRNTPGTAHVVVALAVALVAAACGSDTSTPSPSSLPASGAPASIAPTAVVRATPNPTPAGSPTLTVIGPGAWATTGSMVHGRPFGATATVLQDGRVLVAGGEGEDAYATAAVELYDPVTGRWTATRKMHARRRGDVATLLADGRVLVIGGYGDTPSRGELYDPRTGTWSDTRPMTRWRYEPSAAALADGTVLVFGGWASSGTWTRRVDLYDPASGTWKATARMSAPAGPSAVLADGRVLVMHEGQAPEVFDATTGRWRAIASPLTSASWSSAVRLADGRVLLLSTQMGAAELYDPTGNAWTAASGPHTGRGPATLLADGTVLVVGRVSSARFDPMAGTWSAVPRPPLPRDYALDSIDGVEVNQMVRLLDGKVLATENGTAAIYDPAARSD
jgi:Kelch motif/Galactose oxidase, central domain